MRDDLAEVERLIIKIEDEKKSYLKPRKSKTTRQRQYTQTEQAANPQALYQHCVARVKNRMMKCDESVDVFGNGDWNCSTPILSGPRARKCRPGFAERMKGDGNVHRGYVCDTQTGKKYHYGYSTLKRKIGYMVAHACN